MTHVPRSVGSRDSSIEKSPSSAGADTAPAAHDRGSGYSMYEEEGVSGWALFTGFVIGLVGLFQFMTGIAALAGTGQHAVPSRSLIVDVGYTTWGWVHLLLGFVMLVAGGGIALGSRAARMAGLVLAGLSAVANLAFIPAAPFAATLFIALDVFLIYALTVHGRDMRRPRPSWQ
jgi:hypothetical protein